MEINSGTVAAFGGWVILCGLAGWMAREKGRDPVSFFLVAFFLSPLVGIIAAAAAAPGKRP